MNSNYFRNIIAGNIFGTQKTPAIPAKYYVGISTTAPSADGTGVTEVVGGSYSRVEITSFSLPTNGVIKNMAETTFPRSTTDWGKFTHYVLFDALTGGHLLTYGLLSKPRTVESDSILSIEPNAITITIV